MAKLKEEVIVIKISEMLKDDTVGLDVLDQELMATLEVLILELVGSDKLVEIIKE